MRQFHSLNISKRRFDMADTLAKACFGVIRGPQRAQAVDITWFIPVSIRAQNKFNLDAQSQQRSALASSGLRASDMHDFRGVNTR